MTQEILGIHHITALASNPQENLNFYAGILGLRLVKKTINFDEPDVYHLYYGDETGSPGTILTFFPYPGIPKGRQGKGQLTTISFSISENSVDYWLKRFKKFNIKFDAPQIRFNELVISFEDSDGLSLELVANSTDKRLGFNNGNIPKEHSIKGFHSVTLSEECFEKTANLLTKELNYQLISEEGNRFRYSTHSQTIHHIDILCSPELINGQGGYGTVHHIAFATPDDNTQLSLREKLLKNNLNITPVIDRQYFHSIYFREPGGVLFEIATLPPGFTVDESLNDLGHSLKLPTWLENSRIKIEQALIPISLDNKKFKDN